MKKIGIIIAIISLIQLFSNQVLFAQKSYETLYAQAIQLIDEGKRVEGLEILNKVIGINPTYKDALYARSYFFMTEQRYEDAIRDYDLLILLEPDKGELYLYRGQAKMYTEQFTEAEDDFFQAIALDSSNTEAYNALGSLYYVLELFEDAKINFSKTIQIDPDNIYAHYYRAATYFSLKKYDLALQDIDQILKKEPKDLETIRLRASIFLATNEPDKVIQLYETLQKQDVNFEVQDFINWGKAYYMKKNYPEALFFFELPQNAEDPELYYQTACARFQTKERTKALEMMNKAIALIDETDEMNAKFFYDRAVIKYYLKDVKGGEKDFLQAVYLLPEILDNKNFFGDPIPLLDDCKKLYKPEERNGLVQEAVIRGLKDRAEALIVEGETEKAILQTEKLISMDSTDSYSYTILATCHTMLGDYNQAIGILDKAIQLAKNRNYEKIYYTKSLALKELSRIEEAKTAISEALKLNPKEPEYFSERANIHYEMGDFKNALADIQIALKLSPGEVNYLTDRALYYYENKEYARSIEDCELVINENKNNLMAYYARGLSQSALKNFKQAAEDFKYILEFLPNDKEINNLYENAVLKSQGN